MKRIYLVRHGETILNAAKTHQGEDSILSETGIEQAQIVGQRLKDIPLDLIVASPQVRAKHTAEIISGHVDLPVIFNDDLVEARRPSAVVGSTYDDPKALAIMTEIYQHRHEPNYHHSDEENIFEALTRARNFMQTIAARSEEKILIITHGEILRLLVWIALFEDFFDSNLYTKFFYHTKSTNTGITVLEFDVKRWRLITWNDHSHLP